MRVLSLDHAMGTRTAFDHGPSDKSGKNPIDVVLIVASVLKSDIFAIYILYNIPAAPPA